MAKHLIDLGEGLINELKSLDAQIIELSEEAVKKSNIVKALQVFKRAKLQEFINKNELEGTFNLTESYQLEIVKEEVKEAEPVEQE